MANERPVNPQPSLGISLAIILFFAVIFVAQVILIPSGPDTHMTMIFACAFAIILLRINGTTIAKVEEGIIHGCKIATISMMILMFIGVMIPAWIAAGTIPGLIYWGLRVIRPEIFLVSALIVCAVSTMATGTSWGTAATFGVVMMGIGQGLGIPAPWTAGAVVSGAIFGDSLSPVSDTVNLSAAASEVNIFAHLRSMMCCFVPAFIISAVVFIAVGISFAGNKFDVENVNILLQTIAEHFNVDPGHALLSLIPIIIVIVMVKLKISSLMTIAVSALSAMVMAMIVNGYSITQMMGFMNYGFVLDTGNADVNRLVNRGGLQSMMWTVSLGYLGLSFGGILEKSGVMSTLLNSSAGITKNIKNLVIVQHIAGWLTIALSASPYVAMLIPGRMFAAGYDKLGKSRTICSRTCTTAGIMLDPFLPWTLGGVFFYGALGARPIAVLLMIVPVLAIGYAITGKFMPDAQAGDLPSQGEVEEELHQLGID
ncbi:Na+/H+ antiporter NhaC [Synergistales bacterium]|nr:Na+/H+ antiporter NhaC [Synergistales bacterium]